MNLAALVRDHPDDARAVHDDAGWHRWGEVRRRAGSVAAALHGLGVEPGQRVAVLWPTSADFVVAYLGVLAAGAVAVPLNPHSPPAELAEELRVVGAVATLAGTGVEALEGSDSLRDDPEARGLLGILVVPGGDPDWAVVSDAPTSPFDPVERAADDLAVLLFTSGTAGRPKAAMLTHGNLTSNLEQMLAVPGELIRSDDVGLVAIPLFHIYGLNVALGLALATGASVVLLERFDAARALELVHEHGVTLLVGAPPMFSAWADLPDAGGDHPLSGVRRAMSGAAALSLDASERFKRRYGLAVHQGYGLTETSPAVASALGVGAHEPGSVGRPLPGVEVRLVDEQGEDVLQGDPGELWVRGPNVFAGYWADDTATAEVLTADGWLKTGDIAVVGPGGDLFVVDRKKDLVIVSGFNVFPGEVEPVLAQVPGVAEVVVLGIPDAERGEAVEAVVVLEPGATVTADDIVAASRRSLAGYKCPTSVRFVDELPKGLVGKALRRALREEAGRG